MIHEKLKNDETGEYKKVLIPYVNTEFDKFAADSMVGASSDALVKIL